MLSEARHPLLGRIALATMAAGAALSLSACGLPLLPPALSGGGEEPTSAPETEPAETEEPVETEPLETDEPLGAEEQGVDVLVVGDCLNEMEVGYDDSVSTVPIVDCSDPHDLEVYYGDSLDFDVDYPGRDEVIEQVDEGCYDAFETFVGVAVEESELNLQTLFPIEESWEMGDREYLCLVGQFDGQTTGTLAGANV